MTLPRQNNSKTKMKSPSTDVVNHQLYQQAMLAHHKSPVGFNETIHTSLQAEGVNAACGDEIDLHIEVHQGQIIRVAFHGDSCAICRASASMLCQHLQTLALAQARQLGQHIIISLTDNVSFIGDLAEKFSPLMSVQKFPVRKQCALLPWQTLLLAIDENS